MKNQVMIGGVPHSVSDAEYVLATMPKDTWIEWKYTPMFKKSPLNKCPASGVGLFRFSWNYDGIIGEVDMNGERIALMPFENENWTIKRLEDLSRANGPGMQGAGI